MSSFDNTLNTIDQKIEENTKELLGYKNEQKNAELKKESILSELESINAELEESHVDLDTLRDAPKKIWKERFKGAGIVAFKSLLMVLFGRYIINAADGILSAFLLVNGLAFGGFIRAITKERERFVNAIIPEQIAIRKFDESELELKIQNLNNKKWQLEVEQGLVSSELIRLDDIIKIKENKISRLFDTYQELLFENGKKSCLGVSSVDFPKIINNIPDVNGVNRRVRGRIS